MVKSWVDTPRTITRRGAVFVFQTDGPAGLHPSARLRTLKRHCRFGCAVRRSSLVPFAPQLLRKPFLEDTRQLPGLQPELIADRLRAESLLARSHARDDFVELPANLFESTPG